MSVAMKVESFERETTRVATLTLSNSVRRQFGISSVKRRRSAGEGFQTTDFGSTGSVFAAPFGFALLRLGSAGREVPDSWISVIRSLLDSRIVIVAADARIAPKTYKYWVRDCTQNYN